MRIGVTNPKQFLNLRIANSQNMCQHIKNKNNVNPDNEMRSGPIDYFTPKVYFIVGFEELSSGKLCFIERFMFRKAKKRFGYD